MPALLMRSETTGAAWRVWPDAEAVAPGSVQETGSYLFELHGSTEASTADLLIDGIPLEALRVRAPDTARWRWRGDTEAPFPPPPTSGADCARWRRTGEERHSVGSEGPRGVRERSPSTSSRAPKRVN